MTGVQTCALPISYDRATKFHENVGLWSVPLERLSDKDAAFVSIIRKGQERLDYVSDIITPLTNKMREMLGKEDIIEGSILTATDTAMSKLAALTGFIQTMKGASQQEIMTALEAGKFDRQQIASSERMIRQVNAISNSNAQAEITQADGYKYLFFMGVFSQQIHKEMVNSLVAFTTKKDLTPQEKTYHLREIAGYIAMQLFFRAVTEILLKSFRSSPDDKDDPYYWAKIFSSMGAGVFGDLVAPGLGFVSQTAAEFVGNFAWSLYAEGEKEKYPPGMAPKSIETPLTYGQKFGPGGLQMVYSSKELWDKVSKRYSELEKAGAPAEERAKLFAVPLMQFGAMMTGMGGLSEPLTAMQRKEIDKYKNLGILNKELNINREQYTLSPNDYEEASKMKLNPANIFVVKDDDDKPAKLVVVEGIPFDIAMREVTKELIGKATTNIDDVIKSDEFKENKKTDLPGAMREEAWGFIKNEINRILMEKYEDGVLKSKEFKIVGKHE